jgi:hypothetical protein
MKLNFSSATVGNLMLILALARAGARGILQQLAHIRLIAIGSTTLSNVMESNTDLVL